MKNIFIQTNKSALLLALLAVNVSQISASSSNKFSLKAMLRVFVGGALSFGSQAAQLPVHAPERQDFAGCCLHAKQNDIPGTFFCMLGRGDFNENNSFVGTGESQSYRVYAKNADALDALNKAACCKDCPWIRDLTKNYKPLIQKNDTFCKQENIDSI